MRIQNLIVAAATVLFVDTMGQYEAFNNSTVTIDSTQPEKPKGNRGFGTLSDQAQVNKKFEDEKKIVELQKKKEQKQKQKKITKLEAEGKMEEA